MEIRAHNTVSETLDPARLYSMAQYNQSLLLHRSLFEIGEGGLPQSTLLRSWSFRPESQEVEFQLKENARWSNGEALTAEHLALSITRLSIAAPEHYSSIAAELDGALETESAQVRNAKGCLSLSHTAIKSEGPTLRIKVKQENNDLIHKLTAVFVPVVHPCSLDGKSGALVKNDPVVGPFQIEERLEGELKLKPNPHFLGQVDPLIARIILRNPPSTDTLVQELLRKENPWHNIVLDRYFILERELTEAAKQGASVWTRPVDRVMYLYGNPKAKSQSSLRQNVVRFLGSKKESLKLDGFPGVESAACLPPPGFPLQKPIDTNPPQGFSLPKGSKLTFAIGSQMPNAQLQNWLESALGKNHISIRKFPTSDFMRTKNDPEVDFVIISVGAADPSPVTWLSLIFGPAGLIDDPDGEIRSDFESIKMESDSLVQLTKLRELLASAGTQGRYLPLAHFSSIAIARHPLSLERILESDEAVDLSKVKVKSK